MTWVARAAVVGQVRLDYAPGTMRRNLDRIGDLLSHSRGRAGAAARSEAWE
jgi:hypothetical protein